MLLQRRKLATHGYTPLAEPNGPATWRECCGDDHEHSRVMLPLLIFGILRTSRSQLQERCCLRLFKGMWSVRNDHLTDQFFHVFMFHCHWASSSLQI